ncbi:hypothetical protein [Burkholderia sp. BCC0419]|uniref:hypothetical protein n=1 Tax=Burkholderia sp. BCC0419 TaxID=486878 RepID=UPI001ABA3E5A|nr:hypothetical protein [Burkholderia sp. BCC0419]
MTRHPNEAASKLHAENAAGNRAARRTICSGAAGSCRLIARTACPVNFSRPATAPWANTARRKAMTLLIYLVGWIIFIGGVAWGLMTLHVSQHIIEIVAVILFGIAVITGATRARNRDRS